MKSRAGDGDADAPQAAAAAGLRYVTDARPGIGREKGPLGFRYRDAKGRLIRSARELKRIRALAVPPAWTDVWICPDRHGHIQATGRDARGRKQYRYHPAWRACRDETKYDRLLAFGSALPQLRRRVRSDLARPGLPREKVLASVVRLLETTMIRVGNSEYARTNGSFGLTTLRDKHVRVRGSTILFEFKGKSGIRHSVDVDDHRLASIIRQCRDLPGYELFQYIDDDGQRRDVDSSDVNAYVRSVTGESFTAKDFRTWSGTVLALTALCEFDPARSQAQSRKHLLQAVDAVARCLGNTKAVCRKSYIHPAVLDAYADGSLGRRASQLLKRRANGLRPEEAAVMEVLRRANGQRGARTRRAA